jgi:hypothetical protein
MKIKNKMKIFILFSIVITLLNVSHAEDINVNKTAILVKDTIANDPLKLKQAFAQILANNTGESMTSILNSFEFNSNNIKSGIKHAYFEKIPSIYLTEQSPYKFWFNLVMQPEHVQQIISDSGYSVLPTSREMIMLWVVKDEKVVDDNNLDSQETQLNYGHNNDMTMYWLKNWAQALNMAIIFPAMDEQDQIAVTPKSIKSLSFEAVEQAKNRYQFNHNLLLYVTATDESIKLRSGLQIGNDDIQINHYQQNEISEGELLYAMMADVSHNYAGFYKVNAQDIEKHTVQLVIDSIDGYNTWSDINKYLSKLSIIESFDISSVATNELILTVNLSITSEAFLKIVARDNKLEHHQEESINQLRFSSVK